MLPAAAERIAILPLELFSEVASPEVSAVAQSGISAAAGSEAAVFENPVTVGFFATAAASPEAFVVVQSEVSSSAVAAAESVVSVTAAFEVSPSDVSVAVLSDMSASCRFEIFSVAGPVVCAASEPAAFEAV